MQSAAILYFALNITAKFYIIQQRLLIPQPWWPAHILTVLLKSLAQHKYGETNKYQHFQPHDTAKHPVQQGGVCVCFTNFFLAAFPSQKES